MGSSEMPDGSSLGFKVGSIDGSPLGNDEGTTDGLKLDTSEGSRENTLLGTTDLCVDFSFGTKVQLTDGSLVARMDHSMVL